MARSRVERVAEADLGLERLRPGQREAVEALLDGHDTLAVMPTGYGKSAIYELAGLLKPGLTLVVSPPVALQRDQVEAVEEAHLAGAAELNAGLSHSEREATWARVESGATEFLLLAPEQLARPETLERLRAVGPSLLVVDEAHCISEWGQDFRPDYLRLGAVADELGRPTLLALTATAAPTVRREIVERLRMRDARVIVKGFDRPNIHLAVEAFADPEHKRAALLEQVVQAEKPGIVYAATRKGAEELAQELVAAGVAAAAYHAGLARRRRDGVQDAFMAGELEVVVA